MKALQTQLEDLRKGDSHDLQAKNAEQKARDSLELAGFLERRINEIDLKLRGALSDLESLKDEHSLMVAKVAKERRKFQNCALLLSEYLD